LIVSGDGDVPIFIETGSGNQSDKKDPLFFADSVFLKNSQRVETMAMVMGLCLLVYSIGQRQIRQGLQTAKTGIKNQSY
jgi:transposase